MREPNLWHNLYVEAAHGVCLSALQANVSAYVHLHGNVIVGVVAFVTLPLRCASHIPCICTFVHTYLCTHCIPNRLSTICMESEYICTYCGAGGAATLPIINMAACNGPTNPTTTEMCKLYSKSCHCVFVWNGGVPIRFKSQFGFGPIFPIGILVYIFIVIEYFKKQFCKMHIQTKQATLNFSYGCLSVEHTHTHRKVENNTVHDCTVIFVRYACTTQYNLLLSLLIGCVVVIYIDTDRSSLYWCLLNIQFLFRAA